MKIGVIGGCGFIGSHLVDELVEANHDVVVVDDGSSSWLDADESMKPRFANPAARYCDLEDLPKFAESELGSAEVIVDASLRHPLERELVLYKECLDRVRLAAEICIDGVLRRTLKRFVVVSSLEILADRPTMLGRHLRAFSESLEYIHRPPHFDVEFVHLPDLYGPRQLPQTGDIAIAICGGAATERPTFGNLGYIGDAARLLADRVLGKLHRSNTNLIVSAPMVDSEILYKVLSIGGYDEIARRALDVGRPETSYGGTADVKLSATSLGDGLAATLKFYDEINAEEEDRL